MAMKCCTNTGDPLHSRAACTQPCNVNTHSRAHCFPGARLCEQLGHSCVNNGARLRASARLCRGSPVKAWNSTGEMPYCFPRSSIKFQGHTVQNIIDFDPNWAFPDYRPVAAFKSLRFALFFLHGQSDIVRQNICMSELNDANRTKCPG